MIIVPLSFSHNTLSFENYAECSLDKETKSRYIIVCIIAIPGLYYMVLDLIFYWLPMCSLQRRYLNSSTTNMYTNILNNKCQKYLKSMNSVSILIAVLFFFWFAVSAHCGGLNSSITKRSIKLNICIGKH